MNKKKIFCAFCFFFQHFLLFGQAKITFITSSIYPAKAGVKSLFLAGNFNGWNAADTAWQMVSIGDNKYKLTRVLKPGRYAFKLTRGSWQTVEYNKFGKGIANREFNMRKDTTITLNIEGWQDNFPAAQPASTATRQVHIISNKFDMPQLGRQRRIWIYLPADYQASNRKYPVIYMHDGQNLFDERTAGYGEWGVDELMDQIPVKSQSIIVGIDHGGDERITEYDPFDSKYGKGRGDDYVEFLVKTLKPYIDQHYRTLRDAKHTTIAGSSMGGLISMYASLKYPEVFGNAGIFSPAFWIAPDIYTYAAQHHLTGSNRFYFVCGDAESESMVADMQKMATLVRAKGVPEKDSPALIVKGAQHNEKQWHSDFPGFYAWLTLR